MNQPERDSSTPGSRSLIIVSAIVYMVCVGIFTFWYANNEEKGVLQNIDKQLLTAASALPYLLAPDFHDRTVDKDSISLEEEMENRRRFNAFAADTGLTWLYTVIEDDGSYYFSAPTVSEEEAHKVKRWYYYPYEQIPEPFIVAMSRGVPVFQTYTDEWGTFRSVAVPRLSPGGRHYLACADLEVPRLESLLHEKRMEAIGFALLFVLFSTPFIISHRSQYTRYAARLQSMNRELLTHRDHLERMVQLRTAELMSAKDRAEEAEKAKGRFLAVMSHEIRTPLNTILGMSEVLNASGLAPEQKRRLASITEAGGHLVELINDILDITRLDSMQTELEIRPFMLPALLETSAQVARSTTRDKAENLRFSIETPPGIQTCRMGDATRLKQVLVNLLSNAFKFTHEGRVKLSVADKGNGELLFSVSDTGIGIPSERLRHIFDEYAQVDASTTRKYGGTGLGLAICRKLARIMGGSLWAESVEGKGSTFLFRVKLPATDPVVPAESIEAGIASKTATNIPPVRILVAEDMDANYEIVHLFLAPTPAESERADNGIQAVDMALSGRFGLVLMDLQMPEMDGIEAVRTLRRRERDNDLDRTPVVALTANVLPSRRRQAMEAGCDAVLTKPLLSSALYHTIRDHARLTPATTARQRPPYGAPPPPSRDVQALLGILLEELDEKLESMRQCLLEGDFADITRVAHGLKGAAGSYGQEALSQALQRLEQAAEAEDASAVSEAMETIRTIRAELD